MITSTKNIQKKKGGDKQNPRTNGKSKAIQTKSHTDAYTYTLTIREKGKYIYIYIYIYISLLSKSTSSVWDDLLCIQVFHRCRHIKLIV